MSHHRAETYDGSQMDFTFPSSANSAVSESSMITPSIVTQTNVSIPITNLSSVTPMDAPVEYGVVRRSSLKRSKAIRRKVGWLSLKFKSFGVKFLNKLKKNWRRIKTRKVNFFFRTKSIKRDGSKRSFLQRKRTNNAKLEKKHDGVKSIAELKREIDHWYVPDVQHITPPAPPPHRIMSAPLLELPNRLLRSNSKLSTSSNLSRSVSRTSIAEIKQNQETIYDDQHALEDILYVYFAKIINDRIQVKLNIAKLETIPQSRQDSYIRREILHEDDDFIDFENDDNDMQSTTSSTCTSVSNTSELSTTSSHTSISSTDQDSIVSSSAYFSAYSDRLNPVHHHSYSTPMSLNHKISFDKTIKEYKRQYEAKTNAKVNRAQTLPLNYGTSTTQGLHHLRKVSEYVVEVTI